MSTANEAQIEFWNGPETRQWVERRADYDRQFEPFTAALLGAAEIGAGTDVLDVGCGCGTLTLRAAGAARRATGVDISGPMIERAVAAARGLALANVEFLLADAQTHRFGSRYDLALSRFGVMFFDDPPAAFANVGGALAPGGRFVFSCWQELARNQWLDLPARAAAEHLPSPGPPRGPGPFSLSAADRVVALLEAAGFTGVTLEPLELPMLVGGGGSVEETLEFLLRTAVLRDMFAGADAGSADRARGAVRRVLTEHHDDTGVHLDAASWIVSARWAGRTA